MKETPFPTITKSEHAVRKIVSKVASLPFLWPGEVEDPRHSLDLAAECINEGKGVVIIFTHFSFRDGPQIIKDLISQHDGFSQKRYLNPVSAHQYNTHLGAASELFGGTLQPIINDSSMQKKKFEKTTDEERRKSYEALMRKSKEALQNGETVAIAINASRQPFLVMDDLQRPLGAFIASMKREGVTDFGILEVAMSLEKTKRYNKRTAGTFNLGKKSKLQVGNFYNASELLSQTSFKTIDKKIREDMVDIIPEEYKQPDTFSKVAVIGAFGQTGKMYIQEFGEHIPGLLLLAVVKPEQADNLSNDSLPNVTVHSSIVQTLEQKPDAIVLATANPSEQLLLEIVQNAKAPLTLILPQNGLEIADQAVRICKDSNITLVRASLFTPVTSQEEGNAYDKTKLRIGLSPISRDEKTVFSSEEYREFKKAVALFERSGFDVEEFEDSTSLAYAKALANVLGSSAALTGLSPKDTFKDKELFAFETNAMKERLSLLSESGITLPKVPWNNLSLIPKLSHLPTPLLSLGRGKIASLVAKGRNNQPPQAATKIAEGKPTELLYYHSPFITLAKKLGKHAIADEALLSVYQSHKNGLIDLTTMTAIQKKKLLLETASFLQKAYQ